MHDWVPQDYSAYAEFAVSARTRAVAAMWNFFKYEGGPLLSEFINEVNNLSEEEFGELATLVCVETRVMKRPSAVA